MNKYKFLLTCLIAAALIWSVGCDEDDPEPPPVLTGLEILEVPQTLLANIDSVYTFRVKVADEGVDPEYILCIVSGPSGSTPETFKLYDDGSLNELEAHPYALTPSGDIVPNNDTYTRTVNSRLLTDEIAGDYTFSFSVPDQTDQIYTDEQTITAADIEPCIIDSAPTLSGMESCFESFDIGVMLSRTVPDEIDSVWVLVGENDKVLLTESEVDTLWTATIAPTTFPCLSTGEHTLSYKAVTRFGLSCELDLGTIQFINDSQQLANFIGLPDTIQRPEPDITDTLIVSIDLNDCNLLGSIGYNGVRFDVKRDAYDWYHEDEYQLNDNGIAGDTTAGDGTYTVGLTFTPQRFSLQQYLYFPLLLC